MSYSEYGLDEKKVAQDAGQIGKWSCPWNKFHRISHQQAFNICFANFAICLSCAEAATRVENQHRWMVGDCWKCREKDIIGYSTMADNPDHGMLICKSCIDWAKQVLNKRSQQQEITTPDNRKTMETIEILLKCVVEGNTVKLPNIQLDHKTEYQPVKKLLENIGGKWNTRAQGFVYDDDPTELLAALQRGEKVNLKQDYQFFSTPTALANYMFSLAYDHCLVGVENPRILEPSAGDGALVKSIVKHLPDVTVDCFELMEQNRIKLQKVPGSLILGNNFIEAVQQDTLNLIIGQYDVVLANPPFKNNQDIDHIRAMYKCLKPGGYIVALSSPSWTFGEQKKQQEFRSWLDWLGAVREAISPGQFKESGTAVGAELLIIQKPLIENSPIIQQPKEEVKPEAKQQQQPAEEMRSPEEILDSMISNEQQISRNLQELKRMLNPTEEMDFFKQISELMGQSEVTLVLKPKGQNITVMVMKSGKADSGSIIPPLMLTGSPEDLDQGFFEEISSPLSRITGLVSNAKAVEESLDGASATAKSEPAEKKRRKKGQDESASGSETAADSKESETPIVDVEAEKIRQQEEAERKRLEEEERLRKEEVDRIALEKKQKYDELESRAKALAHDKKFREAAHVLKEALEFSEDQGTLKLTIKDLLMQAAELEAEEL